ncbi:hypothetical protein F66182_4142 [Fusarium sp. NRRL 66182]|nr:hypothetical protein F66182_4142 [Fusarium sp. NRRL 66182]
MSSVPWEHVSIIWEGVEAAKLPTSVFCKAAHSVENRITLAAGGTYSEVCFYNHIRPRLEIEAPWAYWTLTLTPSETIPDMQTEATSLDFIGRICSLMDDHDALDAFDF